MNEKHIGSTFDSWLEEEGFTEDIKHKLRIRMNEIRNQIIEVHRKMQLMSPEEARVKFEEDIAEWMVNYGKVNMFSLEYPVNMKIKPYLDKFD